MEFKGSQIDIVQYSSEYREQLEAFELGERQLIYSSLPIQVLEEGLMDHNRRPCVVLNKKKQVVGFFVLHQYYQHEGYETPVNAVYVRSLSINAKYQGHGYGTEIMMNIPDFVQRVFPDFEHLYLVVDAENQAAWNVYERAGFLHLATNPEGPIGKERLYYLDLSGQYVSKLRLIKQENDGIVLDKNGENAGHIMLKIEGQAAEITDFNPIDDEVRESALRQLATFVRKHYPDVDRLKVETNEPGPYLNVNFVQADPDHADQLMKLIKY
ncbi:GNAT family N-acetyltransferase [Macrococcus hajekii]|uniref:GNAT family N-acetyltransferase n=1 Tax=Macrococcus hajekii TaxID=198482 RepID=A0A4R6BHX6_9STAP|nr:GNAT family N-acetyltransferase [Macrococcus hajekii]TDM01128.1 GNAT family N-acetyltransferase [Macrococcus hajekii]GGB12233.1 N-acetyltransferase [Macrococcus hajekii]